MSDPIPSPENVAVTAGYIAVTPDMLAGSGLLRDLFNALPPITTSMNAIRYIREGEYLDYGAYDGGVLADSEHEPEPCPAGLPRPGRYSYYDQPVRIVEVRPNVVELAADEASMLARAKRCACGHLDTFHNHDWERGTTCMGECECTEVRTRLNPKLG